MFIHRQVAGVLLTAVLAVTAPGWTQNSSNRIRGGAPPIPATSPAAVPAQSPLAPAVAASPTSLLQEPAREAEIVFADDRLSIHAENASLTAILHKIAAASGMRVTGLGNDERVFGTFGPGAPRDVLADLLNGTTYNQLLLGDLSNGAPRELILTPATHAGEGTATPTAAPATADDATPDQEISDVAPPPPPEVTPAPQTPPAGQGVRTPQQLFEQLQQMRQAQQQQNQPQELPAPPPQ